MAGGAGVASRSSWTGAISFGLVTVPVKLYLASTDRDVKFHTAHAADLGRMRQSPSYCETCGPDVPVSKDEVTRTFEYEKGQYVEVTDEDLEALENDLGRVIAIEQFIPESSIDPMLYEKPYYVAPDATGGKAYALLREAMKAEGVVAVAKVLFRQKEHLAVLRWAGDQLVMHQVRWPDEMKAPGFRLPESNVSEAELGVARTLVQSLSSKYMDTEGIRDEYRTAVLAMVDEKLGRKEHAEPDAEPAPPEDLMEALRLSVEKAKKERKAG
jgi:DNA end-binding protein Ku